MAQHSCRASKIPAFNNALCYCHKSFIRIAYVNFGLCNRINKVKEKSTINNRYMVYYSDWTPLKCHAVPPVIKFCCKSAL